MFDANSTYESDAARRSTSPSTSAKTNLTVESLMHGGDRGGREGL
jgi:hypothetical protein